MRKAVSKRIRMTKSGKFLYRSQGKNHFNAKHSRRTQLRTKRYKGFSKTIEKSVKAYAGS